MKRIGVIEKKRKEKPRRKRQKKRNENKDKKNEKTERNKNLRKESHKMDFNLMRSSLIQGHVYVSKYVKLCQHSGLAFLQNVSALKFRKWVK